MSKERTITVVGYLGRDMQMTKEEFTKTWRQHSRELLRIDYSDEWTREVTAITKKVVARVEAEFDRMYISQNEDK